MTLDRYCKWGAALLFAALFPNAAHAQTVAGSFDELRRILAIDETVVVTENSGHQTKGKVVDHGRRGSAQRLGAEWSADGCWHRRRRPRARYL
jgi:hypothetical protein